MLGTRLRPRSNTIAQTNPLQKVIKKPGNE